MPPLSSDDEMLGNLDAMIAARKSSDTPAVENQKALSANLLPGMVARIKPEERSRAERPEKPEKEKKEKKPRPSRSKSQVTQAPVVRSRLTSLESLLPLKEPSKPLLGLRVVLSGVFECRGDREEVEKVLSALGAECRGSISGRTDVLICGPTLEDGRNYTAGKKYKQAQFRGILIVTEEALSGFIELGCGESLERIADAKLGTVRPPPRKFNQFTPKVKVQNVEMRHPMRNLIDEEELEKMAQKHGMIDFDSDDLSEGDMLSDDEPPRPKDEEPVSSRPRPNREDSQSIEESLSSGLQEEDPEEEARLSESHDQGRKKEVSASHSASANSDTENAENPQAFCPKSFFPTPRSSSELLGNNTTLERFRVWLVNWRRASTQSRAAGPRDEMTRPAALVSGPPGAGKSLAVRLIAGELGFALVEINLAYLSSRRAFGTPRIKQDLEEDIEKIIEKDGEKVPFFAEAGSSAVITRRGLSKKPLLLIKGIDLLQDDPQGLESLISLASKTQAPVIFLCNDRHSNAGRVLALHSLDIRLRPPNQDQSTRLLGSAAGGGNREALAAVVAATRGDLRRALGHLRFFGQGSFPEVPAPRGAFEAAARLLSLQNSGGDLEEARRIFDPDPSALSCFIFEGHLLGQGGVDVGSILESADATLDGLLRGEAASRLDPTRAWPCWFFSAAVPAFAARRAVEFVPLPALLAGSKRREETRANLLEARNSLIGQGPLGSARLACERLGLPFENPCGVLLQMVKVAKRKPRKPRQSTKAEPVEIDN